jgi:hypothetical protein
MQLRTGGGLKFVYGSYLRIADEYFIQDTGLKAYVGCVPIEGDQGLEELLDVFDELDEEEDQRMEERKTATMKRTRTTTRWVAHTTPPRNCSNRHTARGSDADGLGCEIVVGFDLR